MTYVSVEMTKSRHYLAAIPPGSLGVDGFTRDRGPRAALVLATRLRRSERFSSGGGTLGTVLSLSRQSEAINFPVSCLSTVWARSWWQARHLGWFYPVVSITTIQVESLCPIIFFGDGITARS